MKKCILLAASLFFSVLCESLPARSFDVLFPGLPKSSREQVFAQGGLIRSVESQKELLVLPAAGSGIDLLGPVLARHPNHCVEALALIPYTGSALKTVNLYNVLGKISSLKGRVYHSASRDKNVALFEEASRVSEKNGGAALPDLPDAAVLPASQVLYLRLKDANFGNTYYRADIRASGRGILYGLYNTKTITYMLFPVMKEEAFAAHLYLEILDEGVLVYSVAGADVSGFISSRINIPSAIRKRIEVILGWISDGIRQRMRASAP
ncbi:MAG: hypothetical protein LBR16_04715 [Treponema sp.]|jgi:hypothetical protein|nr:hypothetical protein [Treponema sp.]